MRSFEPKVMPPNAGNQALVFLFQQEQIFLCATDQGFPIPILTPQLENLLARPQYLGTLDGIDCIASFIDTAENLTEFELLPLKRAYEKLGDDFFNLACRALQIIQWDKLHQFCSRCATPLKNKTNERAKYCPACEQQFYPKFSPSIIVAVEKDSEILLARSPHFYSGMYSVLAGFIEPGESAEQAVIREVREEVGIEIQNLRYFGSQSWPFPDSFMLGFIADYGSGEIAIDKKELEDARWFTHEALPPLPSKASIASRLIAQFITKMHK